MNKLRAFLLSIFLFVTFIIQAQHPVYTQLTEKDGLPDIEFYDIVEDNEGFIWLAADKGLFRYDGKEFKNYTHPEKKGLSVFGLKFDEQGRLWCNNISGQFFYIENDVLQLFDVEIKASGNLATFLFYKNYIWTNAYCYSSKINLATKKETVRKEVINEAQHHNKDTLFFLNKEELSFTTDNLIIKKKKLHHKIRKRFKHAVTKPFIFKNKIFFYDHDFNKEQDNTSLFVYDNSCVEEIAMPQELNGNNIIYFFATNDLLWFCTRNGVYIYTYLNGVFKYQKKYFEGKKITKVIKDRNNNHWFTTLQNGIYIIPNIYVETYELPEKVNNISVLKDVGGDTIIIGSTKGDVLSLHKKSKKITNIHKVENQKVFSIEPFKNSIYISFSNNGYKYSKKTKKIAKESISGFGNIKDMACVEDKQLLIAFYNNARLIDLKTNTVKYLGLKRSYSVHYSKKDKEIYIGFVDGLKHYNQQLDSIDIKFKNKPIFAINIEETSNQIVWVSTFKDGIIGIENGKVTHNYTTENGLLSNQTSTIKSDGNLLWIVTNKSIQVLNTITKKFKSLTPKDGITTFNITDIVPTENTIFFGSNKGLFEFDREKVFKKRILSDFYFKEISIDDEVIPFQENYKLSHDTKKIKISFHTNGFLSEDNIKYQYRLLGASEKWESVPEKLGLVTFNNLASGNYEFQLKANAINSNEVTNTKTILFTIQLPFYKEVWFVLLGIITFVLLVLMFFITRIKRLKSKQKIALEKERMQKQLVASKLESLQAQMNPHFTFNALNSIQNLVLKGSKYEAYDYLTKFSNLIRENLNMSRKSYVSFDEELQMLTKYLDLEQLRFQDNFTYTIKGDEEIKDIKIPTAIIQPYIENAIKHGLLHKTVGERKLSLTFVQEEVLTCIIADNGVGMATSQKIKEKNGVKRTSFSTSAIQERMTFLREYYKTDIGVVYEPLTEGTKVVIKIPFII